MQCGKEGDMNEGNLKIEKIQKSSKAALIVTNIVKILLIVAAVISLIVGFIMIGKQDIINSIFVEDLTSKAVTIEDFDWALRGKWYSIWQRMGRLLWQLVYF